MRPKDVVDACIEAEGFAGERQARERSSYFRDGDDGFGSRANQRMLPNLIYLCFWMRSLRTSTLAPVTSATLVLFL